MGWETYGEDEVEAHLQDAAQQAHAAPHHLEKILAHEPLAAAEIHALGSEHEAVPVELAAPLERPLVQRHHYQVVQQALSVLALAKTLQKYVDHGAWRRPRLIERGDDHGLVPRRGPTEHGLQGHV